MASGADSLAVTFQAWGGLYFHRSSSVSGMVSLALSADGGSTANPSIAVLAVQGSKLLQPVALAAYCTGGVIPANAWTRCTVPLSALAPAGSSLDGIVLREASGKTRPVMYFDDIALTGNSSPPPPPPVSPPPAPSKLVATVTSGVVSLSWNAVSGATGYVVSRATASAGPFNPLNASPQSATTYRDAAVALGTSYWYQVAAVNAAGSGPPSAVAGAAVPPGASTAKVTISPASSSLDACTTAQFSATVTGLADASVTWSIQEGAAGGVIDATGKYTAPSTAGTYHVVASSNALGTVFATVPVTVQDHVLSVAVIPTSQTVPAGGQQQLAATVTTTCGTFPVTAQ